MNSKKGFSILSLFIAIELSTLLALNEGKEENKNGLFPKDCKKWCNLDYSPICAYNFTSRNFTSYDNKCQLEEMQCLNGEGFGSVIIVKNSTCNYTGTFPPVTRSEIAEALVTPGSSYWKLKKLFRKKISEANKLPDPTGSASQQPITYMDDSIYEDPGYINLT